MSRPQPQDSPEPFHKYISQTNEEESVKVLTSRFMEISKFFEDIPPSKQEYAYAPGKWTLKELLQHIIDCERIFNFRALAFARGEKQALPGFDEDDYAMNSFGNNREWEELCEEFNVVRQSSIILFKSFNEEMLERTGICNNNKMTVNALAFTIEGHVQHHINIIKDRYL